LKLFRFISEYTSLLVCLSVATSIAQAQSSKTTISNIDDNTSGWGSCTDCAGGKHDADIYWMAQFQTAPSKDGDSTQFYVSASKPNSNVLFWDKLGAHNSASQFTWDFWVYLDNASLSAQALEYDLFQYVSGVDYMFGTQCTYSSGYWDVWDMGSRAWVPTQVKCNKFTPKVWHHIIWQFHRTSDTKMHYDSLTLDGVVYPVNQVQRSGRLPKGWSEDLGVQWQLDTPTSPLTFNEWVDKVKVTIY
jgi:hypothetical protein